MRRRDFGKASLGAIASSVITGSVNGTGLPSRADFPKSPGLTEYVGNFVWQTKYEDIPGEVIELGKKSILDSLGLALAGSKAQSGALCRQYLETIGVCDGKSTIIGSGRKTSPRFAAFVNGVSIHADDFDDTQLAVAKDRVYGLLVHPTVPVLPAILALAERGGVSGKQLTLAYHVGVEVECKIAEAISPRHYQDGFHSTGTCGPFGSAAACAKLLHFEVEQFRTSRRGAKWPARPSGVKSILVVAGRDSFRDLTLHLDAHMIGQRQLLSGNATPFGECEDGRKHGYGRVHEQAIDTVLGDGELRIVEIIRVNRDTVHKRGEARGCLPRGSYDRGFSIADADSLKILAAQSS